jgi:ATP-binding cassette subfamily C (CFTR/MRP) protein 1
MIMSIITCFRHKKKQKSGSGISVGGILPLNHPHFGVFLRMTAHPTIVTLSQPVPPKGEWPSAGAIAIRDLRMRYREGLPLVLDGVSLDIRGGEKVGVVGRTGAGKSSLMVGLFRLVEAAGGSIAIDGIDISTIGLADLRERLAIIPQDPVLYSGTVRSNLDPFGLYTDAQIWHALERAYLHKAVESLENRLDAPVSENGENLSVGQRCQICLARALLRHAKILILDEATASIDMETDKQIQDTIRADFADCTILTIAHRLNTIVDYDRVLVLDAGKIREYDTPANLLRDPNSAFAAMCAETGAQNCENLRAIAFEKESGVARRTSVLTAAATAAAASATA